MKVAFLLLMAVVMFLFGCEPGSSPGAGGAGPGYKGIPDESRSGINATNEASGAQRTNTP